jgi:ABC-type branched-subunit amino acid transport system substrate-binding protein
MSRLWKALLLIALLGIVYSGHEAKAAGSVEPVFSSEAEKIFGQGLGHYRNGQFNKARQVFDKLSAARLHQHSSASFFMVAKTLFNLGDYAGALKTAKEFSGRFSQSRYIADMGILAGDALFMQKRFYEAGEQYAHVLLTGEAMPPQVQAAERLAGIVKNNLINAQGLAGIRSLLSEERLDETLLFGESQWYSRLDWKDQAQMRLNEYLAHYPTGLFSQPSRVAMKRQTLGQTPNEAALAEMEFTDRAWGLPQGGKPKIGLLLPLSGPQRAIGRDLLSGVELANRQHGQPFELMVRDTGIDYGDVPIIEGSATELVRAALVARQLVRDGALALIGPVFSSTSVAAALVAEAAGVPLIAPLAQQSGLDSLGNYIFQLNVIPEIQGRVLGEYATMVLGLKAIAILSPLTDYGASFEEEFTQVASENGADVVYRSWYVPRKKKDFKNELEELRAVGFDLSSSSKTDSLARLDSLAWVLLDTAVVSAKEREQVFTALLGNIDLTVDDPPDSSELFIETIDAVVVVVESFEDAKTIAPQLQFKRLRTQVLGNDIWNDPDAIRQMPSSQRKDIEGAIFVSSSPSSDKTRQDFITSFRQTFGRYPGYTAYDPGFAAYGYDAAEIIIQGWENQARTRKALRNWLADIRGFEGAGGRVSFSEDRRTNTEMTLMKIDKGGRVRAVKGNDLPLVDANGQEKAQETR